MSFEKAHEPVPPSSPSHHPRSPAPPSVPGKRTAVETPTPRGPHPGHPGHRSPADPNREVEDASPETMDEVVLGLIERLPHRPIVRALRPQPLARVLRHCSERVIRELVEADRIGFQHYVKTRLNERWPVGVGVRLDGSVGITFGIPLHIGVDAGMMLIKKDDFTFELQRRGEVIGALDTGAGGGVRLGNDRFGVSAHREVELMAGLGGFVNERYELPILEDGALIALGAAVAGTAVSTAIDLATHFVRRLERMNPERYLVERTWGTRAFASANGTAVAGVVAGGGGPAPATWGSIGEGLTAAKQDPLAGQPWWIACLPQLRAQLRLEASRGVALTMTPQPLEARPTRAGQCGDPDWCDFAVEYRSWAAIDASVQALLPSIAPALSLNAGAGLRVVFRAQRNAGAAVSFEPRTVEAVVATGDGASLNGWDLEGWKGTGSETSIAVSTQAIQAMLAGAGATNLPLAQRLAMLAPELTHDQRIAYAVPIQAVPFLRRGIADQLGLGNKLAMLGATLEGYLRFSLKIPQQLLASILTAMASAAQTALAGGPQQAAQRIYADFLAWLQHGTLPPGIHSMTPAILALGSAQLDSLVIGAELSLAAGLDARAAADGPKARYRTDLEAAGRWERELARAPITAAAGLEVIQAFLAERTLGAELLERIGRVLPDHATAADR
jgi:hypothetical protein